MTPVVLAVSRFDVVNYVDKLVLVYTILIFAYILANLVFAAGGRIPYSRASNVVLTFLRDVCEPYLRIFRRLLPRAGPLDFSPIVAVFVLYLANRLVDRIIGG